MEDIILRYTVPTRYDKAPYGAICKVSYEGDKHEFYIQIASDDVEENHWLKMGDFLEIAFRKEILEDKEFIKGCLELYKR
jgi:hypothetical protein